MTGPVKNKTQGSDSNMSHSDGGGVARVPKSSGGERKGLSTKSLSND